MILCHLSPKAEFAIKTHHGEEFSWADVKALQADSIEIYIYGTVW
jgi:hypothetical protein